MDAKSPSATTLKFRWTVASAIAATAPFCFRSGSLKENARRRDIRSQEGRSALNQVPIQLSIDSNTGTSHSWMQNTLSATSLKSGQLGRALDLESCVRNAVKKVGIARRTTSSDLGHVIAVVGTRSILTAIQCPCYPLKSLDRQVRSSGQARQRRLGVATKIRRRPVQYREPPPMECPQVVRPHSMSNRGRCAPRIRAGIPGGETSSASLALGGKSCFAAARTSSACRRSASVIVRLTCVSFFPIPDLMVRRPHKPSPPWRRLCCRPVLPPTARRGPVRTLCGNTSAKSSFDR